MKNKFTKWISLFLVCVMVSTFVGCGSKPTEKDLLVGIWNAKLDLTELLNESFAIEEEIAKYIQVDDFSVMLNFTFNEDDSFQMVADKEYLNEILLGLRDVLKTGMEAYIKDMIASMEIEMTLDEFMLLSGMDLDLMLDELFSKDAMDDAFGEVFDMNVSGYYKVDGGKIYFLEEKDAAVDESEYASYTLEEGVLTFHELVSDDIIGKDTEMFKMILPMVLNRATE